MEIVFRLESPYSVQGDPPHQYPFPGITRSQSRFLKHFIQARKTRRAGEPITAIFMLVASRRFW